LYSLVSNINYIDKENCEATLRHFTHRELRESKAYYLIYFVMFDVLKRSQCNCHWSK